MRSALNLSLFARVVAPLVGVLAAVWPAVLAAGDAQAAATAADGRALQAVLDREPGAKAAVAARATELGLSVVSLRVGEKSSARIEIYVAGGAKRFSDCESAAGCPPMVVVPASPLGFAIGSPEIEADHGDDEKLTSVTVRAFAIGARPVTVAEYKACMADGGCQPPEWLEPGGRHHIETGASRYYRNLGEAITGPDQPIVGVSHIDATAYAKWLSAKTGHAYRLPSEAEWEMAARAGTRTAFWWGDTLPDDGIVRAACEGCGSEWDAKAPAPADAFAPNPWGLHNVHGNVWEWVADFYCEDYASGPKDGTPRLSDDCAAVGNRPPARGVRVLRGGSVFYPPKAMRSAMRVRNVPEFRNFSVGFRVARDLAR
ncbi:formylglycine-generating enzyme family protein [Hyphomicrobium sp.]|uniref:formylglycine-generating enzyme family protein n=1 Tax=Hyphomicrobium sp. TaxID=82 RepID=UPI0025C1768A|nr:formylglycine-generating enzyme family protein [Hyphomicrobium sp.]MCC7252832.1 formylglycine-generating enzyme family protein [Hyphomicrobium sp.]